MPIACIERTDLFDRSEDDLDKVHLLVASTMLASESLRSCFSRPRASGVEVSTVAIGACDVSWLPLDLTERVLDHRLATRYEQSQIHQDRSSICEVRQRSSRD